VGDSNASVVHSAAMSAAEKRRRRVLFLVAHLHKGGMQRAISNITQALPDHFEQHVGYFGTENPDFKYSARMHDFNLEGAISKTLPGRLLTAVRRLAALRAYVKEHQIDTVVSFGEVGNLYNLLTPHRARKVIAVRVAIRESLADSGWLRRPMLLAIRVLYPHADRVVAVSKVLAEGLVRITRAPEKIVSIPNLFHQNDILERAKESLPEVCAHLEGQPFLLNVGSLCFQKGQDDLLRVFVKLKRLRPDLKLVIVGRGPDEIALKDFAREQGVREDVLFVDFDGNPYRYMSRCAAFVLTSRFEGFPNVLVEAMTCGAPAVAFDCPTGPSEILDGGRYGALIHGRSVSEAVAAILKLLESPAQVEVARVLSRTRAGEYRPEKVVQEWIKVLS
jgi:glycosyltransferase involved in cell wall biosynthesis